MRIYLIDFNECGYDEYDGFVVRAENEDEAIRIIKKKHGDENKKWGLIDWKGGYKIIDITDKTERAIILGSFNAG